MKKILAWFKTTKIFKWIRITLLERYRVIFIITSFLIGILDTLCKKCDISYFAEIGILIIPGIILIVTMFYMVNSYRDDTGNKNKKIKGSNSQ